MEHIGAALALIAMNVAFSYYGFKYPVIFEKYLFEVDAILLRREFRRLITSGFLHVDWWHLLFNMLSLYVFSAYLEVFMGYERFILLYFISLIGGNLFSLYIHRKDGAYSAVGASGAVCGVVFSSIALYPWGYISFLGLLPIPAWLYGIVFVLYTVYGIRNKGDNIGHEAHFGGAVIGMIFTVSMFPYLLQKNGWIIGLLLGMSLLFIAYIYKYPHALDAGIPIFGKPKGYRTLEDRYNEEKVDREKEMDRILEKIHKKGMNSLSDKEKDFLKRHS